MALIKPALFRSPPRFVPCACNAAYRQQIHHTRRRQDCSSSSSLFVIDQFPTVGEFLFNSAVQQEALTSSSKRDFEHIQRRNRIYLLKANSCRTGRRASVLFLGRRGNHRNRKKHRGRQSSCQLGSLNPSARLCSGLHHHCAMPRKENRKSSIK